ncbi:MAG: hypothetical protein KR126chlam1_00286 [Chlamydiae bacterium]|nr:hypothetical protein [Chlamydiota bacterium]
MKLNTVNYYVNSAATFIGNSVKVLDNAAHTVASCVSYRPKTYACLLGALIAFRPSASLNQTVYSATAAAVTALVTYTYSSIAKTGFDLGCTGYLPNAERCTRLASLLVTLNLAVFGHDSVMSLTLPRASAVIVFTLLPPFALCFMGTYLGHYYSESHPLEAERMTQRVPPNSLRFRDMLPSSEAVSIGTIVAILLLSKTVNAISNRPKTYATFAASASATLYCFMPKTALTITELGLWAFTSSWCGVRMVRSYGFSNRPPSRLFFKNLSLGLIASNIFSVVSSASLRNVMIGNSVVALTGVAGCIFGKIFSASVSNIN